MSLAIVGRFLLYVPVLFLIAIVICGQRHATAAATLRAAVPKTLRWLWMSVVLVLAMQAIEFLFID